MNGEWVNGERMRMWRGNGERERMRKWRGNYIALLAVSIYGLSRECRKNLNRSIRLSESLRTCDSLLAIEIRFDVDHDRSLDKWSKRRSGLWSSIRHYDRYNLWKAFSQKSGGILEGSNWVCWTGRYPSEDNVILDVYIAYIIGK